MAGSTTAAAAAAPDESLLAEGCGVEGVATLLRSADADAEEFRVRAARGVAAGGGVDSLPPALREASRRALAGNEPALSAAAVALPVRLGVHPFGVLAVARAADTDVQALEELVLQASHALQNLVLSAADTGFLPAGYRYLTLQRLVQALRTCQRRGEPCSVLYAQVRDLDEVVRWQGRRAADAVVHHCVEALREAVRDTDIIGRIAQDAFLLILPSTPAEGGDVARGRLAGQHRHLHVGKLSLVYEVRIGTATLVPFAAPDVRVGGEVMQALAEHVVASAQEDASVYA